MKIDKETKLALMIAEAEQVSGVAEKLAAAVEESLSETEEYVDLTLEKVEELALTETRAAEEAAKRHIENGDAPSAYPFLKIALENGSLYGAELIDMIAKNKLADVDRRTVLYSYAITEQFFYNNTGKKLDKIENGGNQTDIALLSEIDSSILKHILNKSLLTGFSAGKYKCLNFTVERAAKKLGVRDYQNTYLLSLRLSDTPKGEIGYEAPWFYTFFIRNKKEQKKDATALLLSIVEGLAKDIASKFSLAFTSIDVLGSTREKSYSDEQGAHKIAQKEAFHAHGGTVTEESIDIDVSVEKDILLKGNICPSCGQALQARQTKCNNCGSILPAFTEAEKSTGKNPLRVNIKEAVEEKALTVLNCSQCGSAIAVDGIHDGDAVLCGSCGAGFLLNAKALGLVTGGLDRRQMELEKPKNAVVPDVQFAVKSLYEGRLGVIIPETFVEMSAEMKALKYSRGTPPDLVLTDELSTTVNFCFSVLYGTKATDKDILPAGTQILKSFKQLMPAASYGDSGVLKESGRSVHYFDCITPAADEDIYNFMIHFSLSGTLVRGSFNCLAKDRWFWSQIFKIAAGSLRFSDSMR